MSQPKGTSFTDVLPELDAGIFSDKINRALSDVALGVVITGKAGKVVITLDMKQIATSNQVNLSHSLKYVKPTGNGKLTEENSTETPMHVGPGGKLTFYPDNQEKLFDAPKRVTE
jgi:hypothetical protein